MMISEPTCTVLSEDIIDRMTLMDERRNALSYSLKEGWDKIANYYQRKMRIPLDDVYWGEFVAMESHLGILGNVRGKRILEIGCGAAQNSIALAKRGADVCGIDLSRNQILFGKRLARKEGARIDLMVGNMETLPFKDESFDLVTTAISLLYVPDLRATFAEVNRVLGKDGYFTFNEVHPLVGGKLISFRGQPAGAVSDYFKRRIVRWTDRLPDGSTVKMHSYYRTLQDYFDALVESGFVIERYLELERLEERDFSALNREKLRKERYARQLYKIMKEVPIWLIFKSRKDRAVLSSRGYKR